MNVIKKIKVQISDILIFTGKSMREIDAEYDSLGDRIHEGAEKMREACVFTESEIKDVQNFAHKLRLSRYIKARAIIQNGILENFVF